MSDELQGSLRAGKVIAGRFRIDRLIGKGGMGEVYAATNKTTGREVALKMIRGAAEPNPEQTRRFLREAKAATAIQHPNVIEVLDVFEDEDGTPVMVMELLRGETLSALRKRQGALRLHEAASILLPVAEALRAAHEKGIVHRDLKPDNIFLSQTPSGGRVPKVLDFGIAKVLDPTSISSETQGGATSTGSILGTPHYMSYEQAMSEKDIDHRADTWAMGVILFEALTGRRPLEFETLGQMYTAFLQGSVPAVRDVVPDLPDDVADVIDRCLQKQRETRLDDLKPLVEVLARYVDPEAKGARAGGTVVGELPTSSVNTVSRSAATQTTAPAVAASTAPARSPSKALAIGAVAVAVAGAGAFVALRRPAVPAAPENVTASVVAKPASAAPVVSAAEPATTASAKSVTTAAITSASIAPSAPAVPAKRAGRAPGPASGATADPAKEPGSKPSLGGVIERPPF